MAASPSDANSAQIRKLLDSRTLRNSDALKRLLDYLGKQALDGHADELKEYTVGMEAFGKPDGYDPRLDSSVRVQAGKLRQKLDEYYRTEGAGDPVIVDLPKGHFRLEFRSREAQPPVVTTPGWWRPVAIVSALIAAAAVSVAIFRERPMQPPGPEWTREMDELWKPFMDSSRPVMLSLGTPLFAKVGDTFFRDPALNTWEAAAQSERVKTLAKLLESPAPAASYNYTGAGEAAGAFELSKLFLSRGREISLEASNALTWEDIGRHNMIFLGPPKYNLQTKEMPLDLDFQIQHSRVENLRPRPGEPRSFAERRTPDGVYLEEGHALITRIPGLHRTGEVLMLAGSSTEATRAAVDYVTRPQHAARLVQAIRESSGRIPPYFQVVVRARFKSQMPIAIEQVAFHALK